MEHLAHPYLLYDNDVIVVRLRVSITYALCEKKNLDLAFFFFLLLTFVHSKHNMLCHLIIKINIGHLVALAVINLFKLHQI